MILITPCGVRTVKSRSDDPSRPDRNRRRVHRARSSLYTQFAHGFQHTRSAPIEPAAPSRSRSPCRNPCSPACRSFSSAITLPMSRAEAAPVSAIAACTAARISSSAHLLRQEAADHLDLRPLLRGELRPAALVVEPSPIPRAGGSSWRSAATSSSSEAGAVPLAARKDVAVLDGGADHAQRAGTRAASRAFIACLQRLADRFAHRPVSMPR